MAPRLNEWVTYGKVYYEPFPGEDVSRVQCSKELHRAYPGCLFQCVKFESKPYTTQGGDAVWAVASFQRVK